jgi:hypothetical protein
MIPPLRSGGQVRLWLTVKRLNNTPLGKQWVLFFWIEAEVLNSLGDFAAR